MSIFGKVVAGGIAVGVFAGAASFMSSSDMPQSCQMNADGDTVLTMPNGQTKINNNWHFTKDDKNCSFSNGSAPPFIIPAIR